MKITKICIIVSSVVLICATVLGIYTYINNKQISERLNNGPSKEIEYQVGNYVNGGLYVNGYTYMIRENFFNGYYDESGEWISQPVTIMYKIDREGNCEEFYSFDEYDVSFVNGLPYIYYYDGWFYFEADAKDGDNWEKIFRISEDGENLEIVYETDRGLVFGIRDDFLIMEEWGRVYAIDLKKGLNFDDRKLIQTLLFDRSDKEVFFGYWIYNGREVYGLHDYDVNPKYGQYYEGNYYTTMFSDIGTGVYEKNNLVIEYYEGEKDGIEIVHTDVLCFNIFNDKLYYMVNVGDDNELRCSDLDGSNEEVLYRTDFDEKLYCKNMVVSEDNIICDFGPGTDSFITDRCIIDMQLEYVNYMSFEDEIKGLNN